MNELIFSTENPNFSLLKDHENFVAVVLKWLSKKTSTIKDVRKAITWSIDRGHPVVMENDSCVPEFCVVTGYEDNGDTLIGWTYCEECAMATNDLGMFVNPARWNEAENYNVLIFGNKKEQTYTDKDSIAFALEVLGRNTISDENYGFGSFAHEMNGIGDSALKKWLEACNTTENTIKLFTQQDIFSWALHLNSICTQQYIQSYFKSLALRSNDDINNIVRQINIGIDRIVSSRSALEELKNEPDKYAQAAREHIKSLIEHRKNMRGWLEQIYKSL